MSAVSSEARGAAEAPGKTARRVVTLLVWLLVLPVLNVLVPALLQLQFTLETMTFFGERLSPGEVESHLWLVRLSQIWSAFASALVIGGAAYVNTHGRAVHLWVAAGCSVSISLFWVLRS